MKTNNLIANTEFGRRKLSQEEWEAQQAKKTRTSPSGIVFGSRKQSGEPTPHPEPKQGKKPRNADPEPKEERGRTNIRADDPVNQNPFIRDGEVVTLKELDEILEDHPEKLDQAIDVEFREGEPRKGALDTFRELEQKREGGPREKVLRLIAAAAGEKE